MPVNAAPQPPQQAGPPIQQRPAPYPPQNQAIPPVRMSPPGPPPGPPAGYPAPMPPAKKKSSGLWIVVAGIILVIAAVGWYFLSGEEEPVKQSAPVATPPAKSAPADAQTIKPTDKQPFEPLPPQKPAETTKPPSATGPTPTTPVAPPEQTKPPTEVSPPSEPPAQPRQPAVRPQTPPNKPTTPTPPKREQGSLW